VKIIGQDDEMTGDDASRDKTFDGRAVISNSSSSSSSRDAHFVSKLLSFISRD